MAITADQIRSYPLSTDRKGYNMEEVDQLLDQVAEEIDELNATINDLQYQLDAKAQAPAAPVIPAVEETKVSAQTQADFDEKVAALSADVAAAKADAAQKDVRIAQLEADLADAKADGNAIAQALIIAQRSADEILSNANTQAGQIIDDAKEDASNILARAQEDKQAVMDEIDGLNVQREDARTSYQNLLKDFISDATEKLAGLSDRDGAHAAKAGTTVAAAAPVKADPATTGRVMSKAQIPVRQVSADTYVTPQAAGVVPVAATPTPSKSTKDLSGFGDTDDDFAFGDVD